ncbi:PilZ domain-containing protein [Paenibacillus sp. FSL K6-0276]|uniref:PilZ domain-containing protein n=1 Tax=unclassified Paenibacillus TaxID=185978 RepID=UPI0028AEF845|nr:PilZ domain-containing protein [Paenibacillus sp.]
MSLNRRKEPFRYVLKEPISFEFHILSINGHPTPSKPVSALLYDISRSGCRLAVPLQLHVETNHIRVGMNIVLNEEPLYIEGTLLWGKEDSDKNYYGVRLDIAEADRDLLPRELRMLAGEQKIMVL